MNWANPANLSSRNKYLKSLCNNPLFHRPNRPTGRTTVVPVKTKPLSDRQDQPPEVIAIDCDSDEFDIDPEYLKFALINRTHQKKRAEERAVEQERLRRTEYLELSGAERRLRLLDSTCTSSRNQTLNDLYGSMAEQVATAESRHRSTFNAFCDRHQPSFWPQMPINLNLNEYKLS
jgi:hypothetical protein